MSAGGYRKGAGRKPSPPQLKKAIYNTKLPQWLRDWLVRPDRTVSGPVAIEQALCQVFGLKPPSGIGKSEAQHQFEDLVRRAKLGDEAALAGLESASYSLLQSKAQDGK